MISDLLNFDDQNNNIALLSSQAMVNLFKEIQEQAHLENAINQSSCSIFMLSTNFQSDSDLRLDWTEDISLWLFGKPAGALAEKLAKPAAAFFVFVTIPSHVLGTLFVGQKWADILNAVGYGLLIPYLLVLLMSLQQQLTKLILKKATTHYIFLATVLYTGSIAHRHFFEYGAFAFACFVPTYIFTVLFFFFHGNG